MKPPRVARPRLPRAAKADWRQARGGQAFRAGHAAEWLAAAWLVLKGYRILGFRLKAPAAEIDILAQKAGVLAVVEVKRRATAEATNGVPLRPNRVHPLWRTDHDNNVGIGAPEIEYGFEPEGDWIDLITVHKGGLFGTDYRMLFPSDGIEGIKRFYLDSLVAFGNRGLACQPAIIGIGLGGSKDICMILGKRASTLRVVGSRNSDPRIAELEEDFKELGNSIGMGAMGFVGKNMVIDCHIEVGYCHTGGLPMSVHAFCLSSRRAVARIYGDGRIEQRTDPNWFTPYQRRETVDWPIQQEAAE